MSQKPLVSVVIPAYNVSRFLGDTLESVFDQTYSPTEIIVVDDGSSDNTGETAKEYSDIKYLHQSNQGVSVARNTGIAEAQGEYLAFLDADDLWKPGKLTTQISYMQKNPEIGITGTKAENFLEPGTPLPSWLQDESEWDVVDYIIPSTMVVRASVFDEIGGFSPSYRSAEDIEWLWRAKDFGVTMDFIDEVLTLRRFHGQNLSWILKKDHKMNMLKIVRASIARKANKTK